MKNEELRMKNPIRASKSSFLVLYLFIFISVGLLYRIFYHNHAFNEYDKAKMVLFMEYVKSIRHSVFYIAKVSNFLTPTV